MHLYYESAYGAMHIFTFSYYIYTSINMTIYIICCYKHINKLFETFLKCS